MLKLRFIKLIQLLSIISLFCANMAFAKDLFVSTTGSDSAAYANNDINNQWLTPKKAWEEALAGDIVYFRVGTYTITSTINTRLLSSADGTAENPITFKNYNNETVTFSSNLEEVFAIQKSYNYISGFNFTGTAGTWFSIGEDDSTSYTKIEYCYADMSNGTGGDNWGFVRVRPGAPNTTVRYCTVIGPGFLVHANTNCLYVAQAVGVQFLNNNLSNAPIGIYFKHANGFATDGGDISYNYITNTQRYSIFTNSNNATFEHNIIGDNNAKVRFNEANGAAGGDNNTWDHNTILATDLQLNNDDGGPDNNIFTNNIIYSYTIEDQADGNVWNYNLQVTDPTIGANDISGSYISGLSRYIGGTSPSTIAGFVLANGSRGKNAATDGNDVGADVSKVGSSPWLTDSSLPAPVTGFKIIE
jgi:hypothetical protein